VSTKRRISTLKVKKDVFVCRKTFLSTKKGIFKVEKSFEDFSIVVIFIEIRKVANITDRLRHVTQLHFQVNILLTQILA